MVKPNTSSLYLRMFKGALLCSELLSYLSLKVIKGGKTVLKDKIYSRFISVALLVISANNANITVKSNKTARSSDGFKNDVL